MEEKYKIGSKPDKQLVASTEKCKKYMIFTKREVYCCSKPDYEGALRDFFWHMSVIYDKGTDIFEALSKFKYPEEFDKIISIFNDIIQSDYDSILYFVALDEGFVWKNPRDYMFKKDFNYYSTMRKDAQEDRDTILYRNFDAFYKF